jgi:hypothetical protein
MQSSKTYTKNGIDEIFAKGKIVMGQNPTLYREDENNRLMYRHSYGKQSDMGWEIHHIMPFTGEGTDAISNLRPLHTRSSTKFSKWTPKKKLITRTKYFKCPQKDKDEVMRLGAKYNWKIYKFYIPNGIDETKFSKWLPPDDSKEETIDVIDEVEPEIQIFDESSKQTVRNISQRVWGCININKTDMRSGNVFKRKKNALDVNGFKH